MTSLTTLQSEASDQVGEKGWRTTARKNVIRQKWKLGNLDDLKEISQYDSLMATQESKLTILSGGSTECHLFDPWLATVAIETVEKLRKEQKTAVFYYCRIAQRTSSFARIMAGFGYHMLSKGDMTQEKYETYLRTINSPEWSNENLGYVTSVILDIINNTKGQETLHIIIDALDRCLGRPTDIIDALKRIVQEAKRRVEILVVVQHVPWALEASVWYQSEALGGKVAVMVCTPTGTWYSGQDKDKIVKMIRQAVRYSEVEKESGMGWIDEKGRRPQLQGHPAIYPSPDDLPPYSAKVSRNKLQDSVH